MKSLLRRSTAYNAVGKHRAALRDLMAAAAIEPAKYVAMTVILKVGVSIRLKALLCYNYVVFVNGIYESTLLLSLFYLLFAANKCVRTC